MTSSPFAHCCTIFPNAGRSWPGWRAGSNRAPGFSFKNRTFIRPGRWSRHRKSISGNSSFAGLTAIRSIITSAAKFRRGCKPRGLLDISSEGHAILYNGGSGFAQWWDYGIREVADKLKSEGGVSQATLDEFFKLCADPSYWTTTIAFTATTARSPN
jgi:hypothetical protein